jgi:hypothetical protein
MCSDKGEVINLFETKNKKPSGNETGRLIQRLRLTNVLNAIRDI